jgi:FkbM family methyltransferase
MKSFISCLLLLLCGCAGKPVKDPRFSSQVGQDQFVYENFFKNHKEGVYVDIGAHNGVKFSNTLFFEKELGWKGICIEPIPEVFAELQKNRSAVCIQGCVSNQAGTSRFLRIKGPSEMLSGLVDKYDSKHLERIDRSLSRKGSKESFDVTCYLFNDLMEKNGIDHIDFLSLDVEGGEYDILSTIDFSKIQIGVIAVENNYNDPRFETLLRQHGFELAKKLEQDMIFVNNKNF